MIAVRPAARADIVELAALMERQVAHQQTFDPLFRAAPGFDWRAFAARRLRRRDARVFVAAGDGGIVGYAVVASFLRGALRTRLQRIALALLPRLRGNKHFILEPVRYGHLEDLYVVPELHGCGVGAALYREASAWLAGRGIRHVEAVVAEGNERTRAFNRKFGFETVRRVMRAQL